jgi:hypothetical protein
MSEFLNAALKVFLEAHGLPCFREGARTGTQDGLYIEPRVFARETRNDLAMIQVDFAVSSTRPGSLELLDSFAGLADTRLGADPGLRIPATALAGVAHRWLTPLDLPRRS